MAAALSPSRASDFMTCPLLYRYRVIDKIPTPPSPAAARGTLVHAVLERLFDLPPEQRTTDAAVALIAPTWTALVAAEAELSTLVGQDGGTSLETWYADAERLVRRWFDLEDPTRLEPAERELYVEVEVDGLLLRGYVDRLDVAPDGAMRVVDYKTGRSPREQFERKSLFQMQFYALVLQHLRGQIPRQLQLVYLGNGEKVTYAPDEQDMANLRRKLTALWGAIERAANSGDWRPSPSKLCDWCDFKDLCPSWGGTPPPLPEGAAALATDPRRSGEVEVSDE